MKDLFASLGLLVAGVGSMVVIAIVAFRIGVSVWGRIFGGRPEALAQASMQAGNALIGFVIVLAVIAGFLAVLLKSFGVQPWVFGIFSTFFSSGLVEHAYAQQYLPNPLQSNSLYDLVVAGLSVAMKFIVYPIIIAGWVASGFKFVYSQGNPEGLKTARGWLYTTVIATVIIFTVQGFVLALRGTAERVFQGAGVQQTGTQNNNQTGTPDGRGTPTGTRTPGSQCEQNGSYGVWDTTGTCVVSSRGVSSSDCTNKSVGTSCTVSGRSGTCGTNEEGTWGCYVTPQKECTGKPVGTSCTTSAGRPGRCATSDDGSTYDCFTIQAPGTSCTTSAGVCGRTDVNGNCQVGGGC